MSDAYTDESRRERAVKRRMDALNNKLPGPIMGGLRVDPMVSRMADLEKRVKRLEELTTPSAIRKVAQA
jgi:hypothetical protein